MQNNSYIIRKIGFLLIVLAPLLVAAQSAEDYPKTIGIGFKAGASYSNLSVGIPLQNSQGFIEPTYGLIFSYIDQKTVGIQIEVNYKSKRWEENPSADYLFQSKLDYLEIPLLTTLHFGNRMKFFVNFGPHLSLLVKKEWSDNIDAAAAAFPYYENRIPRKGDFGLTGGAGIRLQTGFGLIQTEARFTYSFQNLYDSTTTGLDYSNLQTIGITLSYQYLLKHGN
ncbi:MAG: PorT family protein [Bacteroidales bacterium]|nr:PorT family protein [Bacteroidales bacterium]